MSPFVSLPLALVCAADFLRVDLNSYLYLSALLFAIGFFGTAILAPPMASPP